jgi:hypothetical protein
MPSSPRIPWTQKWNSWGWAIIPIMALVAFFLGLRGFSQLFQTQQGARSIADIIYATLQLFVLEFNWPGATITWELGAARLLAPLAAASTAFTGIVVIFSTQFQWLKAKRLTNHFIICGLGQEGMVFTQALLRKGKKVVVIERDATNGNITTCRNEGAIVLVGDAMDKELLQKARIKTALHIISVTEDDGVNTEVMLRARDLTFHRKQNALTGHIPFIDPQLCTFLRQQEIAGQEVDGFRLEYYNIVEWNARGLMKQYLGDPMIDFLEKNEPPPHILIVGLGRMGESMAVHAAKEWRQIETDNPCKLVISIADRKAEKLKNRLLLRYPNLNKICKFIALEMDFEDPEFFEGKFLKSTPSEPAVTHIFVCLGNESASLSAALSLYPHVHAAQVPVLVRMYRNVGLARLLRGENDQGGSFEFLYPFGLLGSGGSSPHEELGDPLAILLNGTFEFLGQAIHEQYLLNLEPLKEGIEPHPNDKPWKYLSEEAKESNRAQASHYGILLQSIGCTIQPNFGLEECNITFTTEEINNMASLEHSRWMDEKTVLGWTYGELRDDRKKRHPDLVSWSELPESSRKFDINTVKEMPNLIASVGYSVVRKNPVNV